VGRSVPPVSAREYSLLPVVWTVVQELTEDPRPRGRTLAASPWDTGAEDEDEVGLEMKEGKL
jgi:hypothetical protein